VLARPGAISLHHRAQRRLQLRDLASVVSYGWGMIPVTVRIGQTVWETAIWPKDRRYVVPIKDVVRAAEGLAQGDTAALELTVRF
jgi:hypothetical protein